MEKEAEFTDGSVLVRPYRASDVKPHYEAVRESIAELSLWLRWCHANYSVEESRVWVRSRAAAWREGTDYSFVITDARDGCILGGCGLHRIVPDDCMANLGYWVRSTRTGQGIATAAASLIARFGFDTLGLNRIQIFSAPDNSASMRVADRIGAVREGILRNRISIHGRLYNAVLFSLIPEDLNKRI